MEKHAREHQESSSEAAVKHAEELKDLGKKWSGSASATRRRPRGAWCLQGSPLSVPHTGFSCSQKLIVEHERYQDLQREHRRMQEDYEERLRAAEESTSRSLEELTQLSEAKLQEKTQLLLQVGRKEQHSWKGLWGGGTRPRSCAFTLVFSCVPFVQRQEESQQQARKFKEFLRQVEEDEARRSHDAQINFEKKLHGEKETNTNLRRETDLVTQKVAAAPVALSPPSRSH